MTIQGRLILETLRAYFALDFDETVFGVVVLALNR